ncbi:MAG: (2Fe-2S)-binding protein [Rhodospirillaceae bacterium]|nr:(2Fe-2S)-binding protein [Rhodospirillaceae bacterium]|tara:strand:- start:3458 stop:4717 length:1260 start_codon:yes stop_codon:yes gene_type:complete
MTRHEDMSLDDLLDRHTPDMSLEQPFYTDRGIFEIELDRIVEPQWLFVEHVSALPKPGDYVLYEIAGESIIVIRGRDSEIRAFFNVCRHRGSRICLEPKGNVRTLTCPYHAWVFDLQGALIRAPLMADDFDKKQWPLNACRVRVWEGLIFINLADDDTLADLDEVFEAFGPYAVPYRLADTKAIHRETYPTDANWKLAVENFRECYHCAPAHPEYTVVNAYVNDGDREPEKRAALVNAWVEEWEAKGVAARDFRLWGDLLESEQPIGAFRQPIREGSWTLSEDGQPVAPLMGDLKEWDKGETLLIFGPLFYVYLANDHATLFRFTPVSEKHTEVVVTWLVREDAEEGRDYDIDKVIWMWDVTTIEDTKIINDNQLGVNSRRYRPGRYSEREYGTRNFVAWYVARMGGKAVVPPKRRLSP